MDKPRCKDLEAVHIAIGMHTTTYCFEWNAQQAARVRDQLAEFAPEEVRRLAINAVLIKKIEIFKIKETREYDHEFYYKLIIPVDCFRHGLFVEMVLTDPDHSCPAVELVNAHAQLK